jgi:hypothetical protein
MYFYYVTIYCLFIFLFRFITAKKEMGSLAKLLISTQQQQTRRVERQPRRRRRQHGPQERPEENRK